MQELYNKYKDILENIPTRKSDINRNEVTLEIDTEIHNQITKKQDHSNIQLKQMALEHIQEESGNAITYTDGSIINNKRGIGIYNNYNQETFSYKIEELLSIKTIEMIAILQAIKIAKTYNITKLTIITDSLSTCLSLKKYPNNKKSKYYESKIFEIIKNNNIRIKLIWIPSHIDIPGNEEADTAARQGIDTYRKLKTKTPVEDNIRIFKDIMYKEWYTEFLEKTTTKGIQHRNNIDGKISMKPWFHKKGLDASMIKRITRIRTNHTYDKKYLKLIKKIESDICEKCNTREDTTHIIEKCEKYERIREKYNTIKNNKLQEILKNKQIREYKELNEFLREAKIDI